MTLRLLFLGSPRIERDGQAMAPDTRKATALLAYLAVTGQFHARDTLAALLWPEMDDQHARAALRRTLSSLRALVGDQALFISREGLGINPEALWCDVTAFEAAVAEAGSHGHAPDAPCGDCLARLEAAVALYRDSFLSGFTLRDSAEFDDWQVAAGERLRRALTTALAWLVAAHSAAGAYPTAIDRARRWLAVDPLREEAHRWLMQLHAWSGARDLALRQYREAVRVLDEELGVEPLPETTALYEAIQENRLGTPAPARVAPPAAPAAATPAAAAMPLVGRETAWAGLRGAYDEVAAGATAGRLVAITGEAGIGKTRLAEAFLEWARAGGATTVSATCYEGETALAYAPFAAALRVLWRRPGAAARLASLPAQWLGEVGRLAPELEGATPAADAGGPGAPTRFYAAIGDVICHLLAGPTPGVFLLDDAHWADDASLDLLAYLARRLDELPVLLVVAWNDVGEAGGDPRLRRLLGEAGRRGVGRTIALTRWRPSDVLALVTATAGGGAAAVDVAGRLYRETEGLPYFAVEYLNALAAAPDSWAMPPSVRDLLAGRLARAGQAELQLLQAAAVIGGSFDYAILWPASGRSEEEVVEGLERLLGQGLIREATDETVAGEPRYDFSHQQLRSLVYETTTLARRRLLHRRVAAALQALNGRGEALASLIGHHYRLGGQEALAADHYRRAGDHARALYANREALGHYETALALGHPATAALHEASGDLHVLLGEYGRGLRAYESAAAQAGAADLGRLEHKLGLLHERRGQWELADSHYGAAHRHYQQGQQTSDLARLGVDRGRVAYRAGDMARARALAEEALALAAGDAEARAQAHNILGILARQAGDAGAARAHLEESLALAESTDGGVRVAALNNLARLRGAAGQIDAALALLATAIDLCVRQGDRHHEAALLNQRADWLHRAGREDEAMASLKAAVAIYADIGQESGDWQPEIWKLTEW